MSDKLYRSKTQNILYSNLVHGLKYYSPEELKKLPFKEKIEIKYQNLKVQRRLTYWKFELIENLVNGFLKSLFHKSKLVDKFCSHKIKYNKWDNSILTFKELGVTRKDIEQKLIEWGFLPQNYYELK